jgi:hypothetical protein
VADVPPGDRLAAAAGEAAALRVAVEELVDTILASVPAERRRWSWAYVLLVIGGPVLFAVTLSFAVVSAVQLAHIERRLTHGVACLLGDTDDHRYTNQFAHDMIAARLGVDVKQQDVKPLTPEQVEKLKTECDNFVSQRLGARR